MNRENTLKIALALALVALPIAAHAGLPSMFGIVFFRFAFGGLFIGMVDGLVVRRYCRAQRRGCQAPFQVVLFMVIANVLSLFAYIKFHNLPLWDAIMDQGGVEWLKLLVLCGAAMAFLLKMIVELPFVWLAIYIEGGLHSVRDVWKASLSVQSISFALLALMYATFCEWSLLTVRVVDVGKMNLPDGVVVKYIAEDGNGKILDVRTGQTMNSDADAIREASLRDYPEEVRYVGGTNDVWKASVISYDGGGFNETIQWHNEKTGREFCIGLQTPIVCWFIEDATMLPDGKIIFRLDCKQIAVADPERKQIAVLARGRHPVVQLSK